ncbi:hypothetical protein ACFLS9_04010 [Bacteroidota bacterium]
MKKLSGIFILIFLFLISSAYAQGFRRSVEEQLEDMKEELDLTEEQADSVKIILEETTAKMGELWDSGLERSSMRDEMRKIFEDRNEKITALLSEEQQERFEEYIEELRNRRRGSRRGRPEM